MRADTAHASHPARATGTAPAPVADATVFPRAGVAARRWHRFEREFRAWEQTSDGRFAAWRAARTIGATLPSQTHR